MIDTTIYLANLNDWETGAPDVDPNRDTAFDAAERPACAACQGDTLCADCAAWWSDEGETLPPALDFAATLPALPAPWRMSISELDSWLAYYRGRLRLQGRGCGALTAIETTHRGEVEANINARHDARRHSAFTR